MIALKTAGVSDKVVAAMVSKGLAPVPGPCSRTLVRYRPPAGIDEVGVYMKDKTGAWNHVGLPRW